MAGVVRVRTIMLGRTGSGKSTFMIRWCQNHFAEGYDLSMDDAMRKSAAIDGIPVVIEIMDVAGHPDDMVYADSWYAKKDSFMLVYDMCDAQSFEYIQEISNQIHSCCGGGTGGTTIPVMIIATKADMHLNRVISTEQGQAFAATCSQFNGYYEVSAKQGTMVMEAWTHMLRLVVQNSGLVPKNPYKSK